MNTSQIKTKVAESFDFLNLLAEEINSINASFDTLLQKSNKTEKDTIELLESLYFIKISELLDASNFEIIVGYLNKKDAKGRNIITELNGFLKKLDIELSFEIGNYLVENYNPLSAFFDDIINYINKENGQFKDIMKDDNAELLFNLYCESKGIDLGEEAEIPKKSKDNYYSDDSLRMYFNEISKYPLLTPEEEKQYFDIYINGDSPAKKEAARHKIINSNLRLVVRIAKQFCNRLINSKVSFQELIQEGNIGLMKGVEKFDPSRGYKFSTYATWWIRQSISRYLGENMSSIRIPTHLAEKIRRISRISEDFYNKNNREATIKELAELTEYPESVIRDCQSVTMVYKNALSLDDPVGEEDDTTLKEFIPSDEKSIQDQVEDSVLKDEIRRVLDTLTPKEKEVIIQRFGLDDNIPRSLEEIGQKMGVTRERIRQIEAKALRKLRTPSRLKLLGNSKAVVNEVDRKPKRYQGFIGELKKLSKEDLYYVISGLTEKEKTVLYRKCGEKLDQFAFIGKDEEFFVDHIIPKLQRRYIRIKYHTSMYDDLFGDADKRIPIYAYYSLTVYEQELLRFAYGDDLSSQINEKITLEDERKIAKSIVPKMLSFKTTNLSRQYINYDSMLYADSIALPSDVVKLFMLLFPNKNITILDDTINSKKTTLDGIVYILNAILRPDQVVLIMNRIKNSSLEDMKKDCHNNSAFSNILDKLRHSPHMIRLSNKFLELAKNADKEKGDTHFYSFFSKEEIKKLPLAMQSISFEDLVIINKVFKAGLSVPIFRRDINDNDYRRVIEAVRNIKLCIKNVDYSNVNYPDLSGLREVYRYCDYLYGQKEFIFLTKCLSQLECEILIGCLSMATDLGIAVRYVANKKGINEDKVIFFLKTALQKILVYLQDENNKAQFNVEDVNLVLRLAQKNPTN